MLIGARFVQGVGGALTSAVILGMIVTMFPEPREQAKAIGVYGFVASAGGSIGLLAGGAITDAISWHWIFFINVPVGLATALPRDPADQEPRRASASARAPTSPAPSLLTGGLMLGVYNILQVSENGWGATQTFVARRRSPPRCVAAFIARQARIANPLMPLRLFRSRNVSGRQRGPGAARRGHVRHVLPRRAVPAADPRLRPARGRPRVPALDDRRWARMSLRVSGPADHAVRPQARADLQPRADRHGPAAVRPHPGRRQLLARRDAGDDLHRLRRRPRLPRR